MNFRSEGTYPYSTSDGHLDSYVSRHASWAPNSLAAVDAHQTLTYAQLNDRVNRLSNLLRDGGLVAGDRVGLLMGNRVEVFEGFYGCARAGMVRVPFNTKDGNEELFHKYALSLPSAIIAEAPAWRFLRGKLEAEGVPLPRLVLLLEAEADDDLRPGGEGDYAAALSIASSQEWAAPLRGSDLVRFGWTGGTTGYPKAVMRTVDNEIAVLQNILAEVVTPSQDDKLLHTMPLAHGSGLLSVAYFARGSANFVMSGFNALEFVRQVAKSGITDCFLVPSALYKLLDLRSEVPIESLLSLETIVYGASPMSASKLSELIDWLGPRFVQVYGQAEATLTISCLTKKEHLVSELLRTAGRPSTRDDVAILDEADNRVADGGLGQVCVRGEHVSPGYWANEPDSLHALRGGWLHTGDVGRFLDGGYLELVSRMSGVIISGGFNIYPAEVENALYACEGLAELAVVGKPDDLWGEAVTAVIVPSEGTDTDDLIRRLKAMAVDRLGSFKRPKEYAIWPARELPKSPVGKVLGREVLRLLVESKVSGHSQS